MNEKQEINKENTPADFIRKMIAEDIKSGKNNGKVVTRFPPEPNGCLHIGHAKAFCLDFGVAEEFGGVCHLRFDDTNPEKEDMRFIDLIKEDINWLGFDWKDNLYFASDYYDRFYEYAVVLINKGKAYVDDLSADEIRDYRGTPTRPGKNSPHRERSVNENLNLFERMKNGEFKDGECVLRAKIDMAHTNIVMRDPALYRIKHVDHFRTGCKWCIYPMYDFAHCISDSIEGITHSLCSLEFENNRPLYDWVLNELETKCHPKQIEFARLNLTYTVMSKRKLMRLVEEKHVGGWDDPRMPTLSGLRRRGCTPVSILKFLERISVDKTISTIDVSLLEYFIREDLNRRANRVMAVLNPVKVVITNYPEGKIEDLAAENNPEDQNAGIRNIVFSREIYIEKDDFNENPPAKYFRLAPGREVRLKHAYYILCEEVINDPNTGEVTELHCSYDPKSRGGWTDDGRKVRGTLHWVSVGHAIDAEVRIYDRLFTKENPEDVPEDVKDNGDFISNINPNSLKILKGCKLEKSLINAAVNDKFQFLRHGYFCLDKDCLDGKLIFNRTVSLKDTWAKISAQQKK